MAPAETLEVETIVKRWINKITKNPALQERILNYFRRETLIDVWFNHWIVTTKGSYDINTKAFIKMLPPPEMVNKSNRILSWSFTWLPKVFYWETWKKATEDYWDNLSDKDKITHPLDPKIKAIHDVWRPVRDPSIRSTNYHLNSRSFI